MRHWMYGNVHALILPEEEEALAAALFPDPEQREAAHRRRRGGRSDLDRALDRALRKAYDADPASFRQRYVVRKVSGLRARKVFAYYVAIYEAVCGAVSLHEAPRQHLDGASLIPVWQHVQNDRWVWSLSIRGGWPRRVRVGLNLSATAVLGLEGEPLQFVVHLPGAALRFSRAGVELLLDAQPDVDLT